MNSYFLDWRLKEYLTLKGIKPKIRQIYVMVFILDSNGQKLLHRNGGSIV